MKMKLVLELDGGQQRRWKREQPALPMSFISMANEIEALVRNYRSPTSRLNFLAVFVGRRRIRVTNETEWVSQTTPYFTSKIPLVLYIQLEPNLRFIRDDDAGTLECRSETSSMASLASLGGEQVYVGESTLEDDEEPPLGEDDDEEPPLGEDDDEEPPLGEDDDEEPPREEDDDEEPPLGEDDDEEPPLEEEILTGEVILEEDDGEELPLEEDNDNQEPEEVLIGEVVLEERFDLVTRLVYEIMSSEPEPALALRNILVDFVLLRLHPTFAREMVRRAMDRNPLALEDDGVCHRLVQGLSLIQVDLVGPTSVLVPRESDQDWFELTIINLSPTRPFPPGLQLEGVNNEGFVPLPVLALPPGGSQVVRIYYDLTVPQSTRMLVLVEKEFTYEVTVEQEDDELVARDLHAADLERQTLQREADRTMALGLEREEQQAREALHALQSVQEEAALRFQMEQDEITARRLARELEQDQDDLIAAMELMQQEEYEQDLAEPTAQNVAEPTAQNVPEEQAAPA
ncbi:hypothetical protein BASA81_015074 [Batrachochytrium salamandrivorans]|nr:hypothetical protein BASA81_015074 [Batrachochytrium salamandrivorans]